MFTPNLESLASKGIILDSYYSTPRSAKGFTITPLFYHLLFPMIITLLKAWMISSKFAIDQMDSCGYYFKRIQRDFYVVITGSVLKGVKIMHPFKNPE